MGFTVLFREENQAGPVPASGTHAEVLAELDTSARALIRLIELERSGVYDGLGQQFLDGFGPGAQHGAAHRQVSRTADRRVARQRWRRAVHHRTTMRPAAAGAPTTPGVGDRVAAGGCNYSRLKLTISPSTWRSSLAD